MNKHNILPDCKGQTFVDDRLAAFLALWLSFELFFLTLSPLLFLLAW